MNINKNDKFLFSRSDGVVFGKITLKSDGTISEYDHHNERFWKYDGNLLYLLNGNNKITSTFLFDGEKWKTNINTNSLYHILLPLPDRMYLHKIEIDIVDTCNLSCRNCHHLSPFRKENKYNLEDYKNDIKLASKFFRIDTLRLLGGEPLILGGEKLLEFVKIARDGKFCSEIEIFTNGLLLPTLSDYSFLDVIDRLYISYYPNIGSSKLDKWLKNNNKNFKCKIIVTKINTFHKTITECKHDARSARNIWSKCCIRHDCNNMQKGKFYGCPLVKASSIIQTKFNIKEDLDDSIDLTKINDLSELELAYNTKSRCKPYKMCYYCDVWRRVPHVQEKVEKY